MSVIDWVSWRALSGGGCPNGDPLGQLALGTQVIAVDVQPAPDHLAFPLHRPRVGGREEKVGACRIDPHQEAALAACRYRYLPGDEEGESSEHRLFGHPRAVHQQLSDAVGQVRVVGHYDWLGVARPMDAVPDDVDEAAPSGNSSPSTRAGLAASVITTPLSWMIC